MGVSASHGASARLAVPVSRQNALVPWGGPSRSPGARGPRGTILAYGLEWPRCRGGSCEHGSSHGRGRCAGYTPKPNRSNQDNKIITLNSAFLLSATCEGFLRNFSSPSCDRSASESWTRAVAKNLRESGSARAGAAGERGQSSRAGPEGMPRLHNIDRPHEFTSTLEFFL